MTDRPGQHARSRGDARLLQDRTNAGVTVGNRLQVMEQWEWWEGADFPGLVIRVERGTEWASDVYTDLAMNCVDMACKAGRVDECQIIIKPGQPRPDPRSGFPVVTVETAVNNSAIHKELRCMYEFNSQCSGWSGRGD